MILYKEKYKEYNKLQNDFNLATAVMDKLKIFKKLSGDKETMTVLATFVKKYDESPETAVIGILPKFFINGNDVIPFNLFNKLEFKSGFIPKQILSSSTHSIDNEKWQLIKALGDNEIFMCDIFIYDTYATIKRKKAIFSFNPQTIKKIPIVDIKQYINACKTILSSCSIYQLFDDENKSENKKEWNYDDFLILLEEDIFQSVVKKAEEQAEPEKKRLSKEVEDLQDKQGDLNDCIKKAEYTKKQLDVDIEKKHKFLKEFLLDTNIASLTKEMPNNGEKKETAICDNVDNDDILKSIQDKLKSNAKLEYSKSVIEQMCAGLYTNQLIVLVGDPGSGKTSFASNFGKNLPLEGETKIIPVQPGWMDKSDLLGYYNPIEMCYVPTVFLDTLIDYCIDAKKNPGKYYFICLDEMNLSQIEYYFADFLSKLQTDRTISLYSNTIYEEIRSDFLRQAERFVKMHKGSIDDIETYITREEFEEYLKLEHTKKSLERYKSEIIIPENVKFIGTLNQDETTKDISPKVLDRSIVIKLQNNVQKCILEKEIVPGENIVTEMTSRKNHWEDIIKDLQKYNLTVSKRLENVFKELDPLFNDNDKFFDTVISTMILPKINCSPYQTDIKNLKTVLDTYCTPNRVSSYNIFLDMKNRCENEQQDLLTFWSK